MSRIADKIVQMFGIPDSDILRITSDMVAVKPSWESAIRAYLSGQSQGQYSRWLDRGYKATRRLMDSSGAAQIIVSTGSQQGRLRSDLVECGTRVRAINSDTVGYQGASGDNGLPLQLDGYYPGSALSLLHYIPHLLVSNVYTDKYFPNLYPITVKWLQRTFCGAPVGGLYKVKFPQRNMEYGAAGSVAGQYSEGTVPLKPLVLSNSYWGSSAEVLVNNLTVTHEDWLLVEGPMVFDRAEFVGHVAVDAFAIGAIAVQNKTIADAIELGLAKGTFPSTTFDTTKLRANAGAGMVLLFKDESTNAERFSPYELYSKTKSYYDKLIASTETVDGVDLSGVPSWWDSNVSFNGVFGTKESANLPDAYSYSTDVIADGGTITVTIGADSSITVSPLGIAAPSIGELRTWTANTRGMGYMVDIVCLNDTDAAVQAAAIMAQDAMPVTLQDTSGEIMTADSFGDAIGLAMLGSYAHPLTQQQKVVVNVFLQPAYLASVTRV